MPNPHQHVITTRADLIAALAGVPDECRVVVMDSEGHAMRCEVMALRVGDALVLMVCEDVHGQLSRSDIIRSDGSALRE